jgi:hypothetical protein
MMLLNDEGLPILDQNSEEGFVDLAFKINSLKSDESHYYFDLLASRDNEKVGLAVKLVKTIGPGFDGEMNVIKDHVYDDGVSFRSLGVISDRLMTALAKLYGVDDSPRRMVSEEAFTAIALHQADTELERHSVRLKLFGRDSEPFVEDEYYESFFNVDLPNGWVFWNEKDPDYRAPLLKALSAT